MSIFGQSCPVLSDKIRLNPFSLHGGEVDVRPHHSVAQDLETLRSTSFFQDSIYLLPSPGGFCAYPLRPVASPTFSLADFYPTEAQGLPERFGKPTSLEVPPNLPPDAAVYEIWSDRVYVPDVRGLRWYLVGDAGKYQDFLEGISLYAENLLKEWRQDRYAMVQKTWTPPEDLEPTGLPDPTPFEAWWEIAKFGAWMKRKDPELWAQAQPRLEYALEMPKEGCKGEITEDGYAYYTPLEDRILLLPRSVHLLKAGNYPAVAQVLAHELAHRDNSQAGLVLPSDEMMQRSLELFHGRVLAEDPLGGIGLSLLGDLFYREMNCRRLPMLPEEELDAFSKDLRYGRSQNPALQSGETQTESIEAIGWLIDQVDRNFPAPWRRLIADYVELAQANRNMPSRAETPSTPH